MGNCTPKQGIVLNMYVNKRTSNFAKFKIGFNNKVGIASTTVSREDSLPGKFTSNSIKNFGRRRTTAASI